VHLRLAAGVAVAVELDDALSGLGLSSYDRQRLKQDILSGRTQRDLVVGEPLSQSSLLPGQSLADSARIRPTLAPEYTSIYDSLRARAAAGMPGTVPRRLVPTRDPCACKREQRVGRSAKRKQAHFRKSSGTKRQGSGSHLMRSVANACTREPTHQKESVSQGTPQQGIHPTEKGQVGKVVGNFREVKEWAWGMFLAQKHR
jgi:hypothetical protein